MFICDCCGLCCINLRRMPLVYGDLDRGDGICRFFDCNSHLCTIYETRPDKCNIGRAYDLYFKDIMEKNVYYQLNYEMCKTLKHEAGIYESKSREE